MRSTSSTSSSNAWLPLRTSQLSKRFELVNGKSKCGLEISSNDYNTISDHALFSIRLYTSVYATELNVLDSMLDALP